MIVADALSRIDSVLDEAPVSVSEKPQHPKDSSIALHDVRFSYDGRTDVIRGVSMDIRRDRPWHSSAVRRRQVHAGKPHHAVL